MAARRRKTSAAKPRRRGGYLEHREQVQFVAWFRLTYPDLARLLYAIPNGVATSKANGARLKAEGVTAGIPDLCLAVPRNGHHGLYIEMKRSDGLGRVSKSQHELIDLLRRQGYQVSVCHGADEARSVATLYLGQNAEESIFT